MTRQHPSSRRTVLGGLAASVAVPAWAQRAYAPPRPGAQITVRPARSLQAQPMRIMTGSQGGTFIVLGADLSDMLGRHGFDLRVVGSNGSADNARALVEEQGVDLAFVAADAMAAARTQPSLTGFGQVRYVSRLGTNDLHIIARDPAIRTIRDLAGKRVVTDVANSGTAVTAPAVFGAFNVQVQAVFEHPRRGVTMLANNEVDALCYAIGKPGNLFTMLRRGDTHFVAAPLPAALATDYLPQTFTHADYPNLVPEGQAVEGVAVAVVLACYGWPVDTERYGALVQFSRLLVDHFAELQQPPCHEQWRTVSLFAPLPGWQQFEPFKVALADRQARHEMAFSSFLGSLGRSDATGDERTSLRLQFEGLRR